MHQIAPQRIFISKHFRGKCPRPPWEVCRLQPPGISPPNDNSCIEPWLSLIPRVRARGRRSSTHIFLSFQGWRWKQFRQIHHPSFWVCSNQCKSGCGSDLANYSHCNLGLTDVNHNPLLGNGVLNGISNGSINGDHHDGFSNGVLNGHGNGTVNGAMNGTYVNGSPNGHVVNGDPISWNVPTGECRFSKYSSTHIRILKSEDSSKSYFYLFI